MKNRFDAFILIFVVTLSALSVNAQSSFDDAQRSFSQARRVMPNDLAGFGSVAFSVLRVMPLQTDQLRAHCYRDLLSSAVGLQVAKGFKIVGICHIDDAKMPRKLANTVLYFNGKSFESVYTRIAYWGHLAHPLPLQADEDVATFTSDFRVDGEGHFIVKLLDQDGSREHYLVFKSN